MYRLIEHAPEGRAELVSAINAVYARRFTAPYPARSAIAAKALPLGARIECVAW